MSHTETDTTPTIPLRLGYDSLSIFQQYWWGQTDPLYAILSRRGNSVDWVNVDASLEELRRLRDLCAEIRDNDKSEPSHVRVATSYADKITRSYIRQFGRVSYREEFSIE